MKKKTISMQSKIVIWRKFDWIYLVIAEFSVCNLGNYAVLTILSIYFVHNLSLPAAQAGGMMLFTSLSVRLSRLYLAPLVDRFPVHRAIVISLFLTSLGYLGMTIVRTPLLVLFLLFVVGVGLTTNGLLVKTIIAQVNNAGTSKQSPFLRYAFLTTGVNIAAAIGSVLGGTLLFHWGPAAVFFVAAATSALSGCIAMTIPSTEEARLQRPKWGVALQLSLRLPALWRAMLFAFLGWFLYTQSYASLPLFVSGGIHRPDLLGSFFALNAVLVVAGQFPVSKSIISLRLPTSQSVFLAFFVFAGGFALLWFFHGLFIVYGAVVLWTLAEMLLMPALDTLVAEGALAEHKQVGFAVYSIAVALGEGIGNLFGVSFASFSLRSGNASSLYELLTLGALAAMVIAIFAASRRESMVLRLLNGQPLRPTGQTQLLLPEPAPMEKGGITQSLITWLSAGSYHDERIFFEIHPELVALDTGQLSDFIKQRPDQPEREMLADRLTILHEIRSRVKSFIRMAYINMYGGLVLDLPPWLEEIKQHLANMSEQGRPDQTAFERMLLLHRAIERARNDRTLAPEIIAELQVLYAIACIEVYIPERAEAMEAAIASCASALAVYTLAQYPYQYARAQVFLSLAYQNRSKGERRANLEQAITCYKAAAQGYSSDTSPTRVAATQATGSHIYAQHMIEEKRAQLEQAIAYCQFTLQKCIERENVEREPTQRLIPVVPQSDGRKPLPEEGDDDQGTHMLVNERARNQARAATHVEWIASQTTQRLQ